MARWSSKVFKGIYWRNSHHEPSSQETRQSSLDWKPNPETFRTAEILMRRGDSPLASTGPGSSPRLLTQDFPELAKIMNDDYKVGSN